MLPKYKNPRLKFKKDEQKLFLNKILLDNKIGASDLAKITSASPRTIRDWCNQKYNISEKAVLTICKVYSADLPPNMNQLKYLWQIESLLKCVKGGQSCYRLYGNFSTPEGRRLGGHRALQILREKGLAAWISKPYTTPKKSTTLAEFVGIMLGDGGITETQATITLNTIADKQYIKFVTDLGDKLFGQKPKIAPRKDCLATNLRYSGINLVNYLLKIGLKPGDKVKHQVGVPDWILKSTKYKVACLRGLMDTDGCISKCTHKYRSKSYTYLNPCFANRSKPLLDFVTNTLSELKLHPSVAGERIWLYNKQSVINYFKIVGSSNYRLLRYQEGIPNGSGESLLNFDA